jgi:hypothetical protein
MPTFEKPKNHPRFGKMSSLTTLSLKLQILKKYALATPPKRF